MTILVAQNDGVFRDVQVIRQGAHQFRDHRLSLELGPAGGATREEHSVRILEQ